MPAYVIGHSVETTDEDAMNEYGARVAQVVERYGGRYIVDLPEVVIVEGDWSGPAAIIEFTSLDAARAWYESEDYAPLKALRRGASKTNLVFVEGVSPD